MNMHGVMVPVEEQAEAARRNRIGETRDWLYRHRVFLLVVVAPVLLVAGYLFLIAADQYESEAHFLVRSTNTAEVVPGTGVSQALSMVTGLSASQNEAMSVADYLTSHDAVETLRKRDDLVQRFQRPEADVFSRLHGSNPTPERLLRYYLGQVKVNYNTETGITTLKVHGFQPADSYEIARELLELGERRVNAMNVRSYNDAIAVSRRQLEETETALTAAQGQITRFRQNRADIDPEASGKAQIGLVSTLTGQLAAAQAQLNAMGGAISRESPQYRALSARVAALRGQIAAQSSRLAGGSGAIAGDISGYQGLQLRQEFLAKRYEAAAASLDRAREQALRQQLYIIRVVEPNMPVKALFPERFRILGTIAIALLLAYSIGWLIVAGVREHSA